MNREQAIKQLKSLKEHCESWADEIWVKDVQALDIAIQALEKQVPIKPDDISRIYTHEIDFVHNYQEGTCICGEDVFEHEKYCHYCGQKLEWS